MSEKAPVRSSCRACGGDRQHKVISNHSIADQEGPSSVSYQIVECLGCTTIGFREEVHDVEAGWYDENDEYTYPIVVETYPKFIADHQDLSGIYYVPKVVRQIYKQTLIAIQERAGILAGLGLRGIIEAICNDRKVSGSSLEARISKMASLGLISKKDAERLHAIRFLGNDAAHDIKEPSKGQISVALKIVEHALNTIYILDKEARGELETAVSDYDDFIRILDECLSSFKSGDELPLGKLLGQELRRVKEALPDLEKRLVADVSNGLFAKLALGQVEQAGKPPKPVQMFKVV